MRAVGFFLSAATALFMPAKAAEIIYCLPDDCSEGHVYPINAGRSAVRINPCWANPNGTGVRCAECDYLIAPNITAGLDIKICDNNTVA